MVKKILKLKPGVPRKVLFLAASAFWMLVGVDLLTRAFSFFIDRAVNEWIIIISISGVVPFYYFVFRRVTDKYISRIKHMKNERPCLFGFFDWRGYAIMLFMITLGVITSMLPFIPEKGLHAFFISLGGSLFLSAIQFFIAFVKFIPVRNQE